MRDSSFIVNSDGETCEDLKNYAHGIEQVSNKCSEINFRFQIPCCPEEWEDPCEFCDAGLTVDPSALVPGTEYTCGDLLGFSRENHDSSSEDCVGLHTVAPFCCPADPTPSITANTTQTDGGICPFCPNGLSDETRDAPAPEAQGATCNQVALYATSLAPDSSDCTDLAFLEPYCCPGGSGAPEPEAEASETAETTGEKGGGPDAETTEEEGADAESQAASEAESAATTTESQGEASEVPDETFNKVCGFCGVGGVSPDAAGTEVPESSGLSCSDLFGYAQTLAEGAEDCDAVVLAEPLCCPGFAAARQSAQDQFEALVADGEN